MARGAGDRSRDPARRAGVASAGPAADAAVDRTGRAAVGWQLVVAGFLVLLPVTLLLDLHPHRERLDAAGRPLRRRWDDRPR